MSSPSPSPGSSPLTVEQAKVVREHLKEVRASSAFAGSKRAQEFLQYTLDHALAGETDSLRERMIGAELFGRPVDYDTANDAVVRVKATEVRRKLAQYYRDCAVGPIVRIELPIGSYVPKFVFAQPEPSSLEELPKLEERLPAAPEIAKDHLSKRPIFSRQSVLLLPFLLLLIAVAGWMVWKRMVLDHKIKAIAILPLLNLTGDSNQEYFVDGMTEELNAELSQLSSLRVISRTSTMTYKGTRATLPEIGRQLDVDYIVEGSVVREGNQVRITIQLIDSKSDHHLWAQTYDRDMTSVLELQSEVARAIVNQIRVELTPEVSARLSRSRLVDPEAMDFYLRGMQSLDASSFDSAVAYLQRAVDKDPAFAEAHAGLAAAYGRFGESGRMSYEEAFSKQRAEALKAIELDDSRAGPHLQLGSAALNHNWDWATQEKELKRALQVAPNEALVHWAYASFLLQRGHAKDGIREAKSAFLLDPVSSRSSQQLAYTYYFARSYGEAADVIQEHLTPNPFPLLSGSIFVEQGKYEQAIAEFKRDQVGPHTLGHLGNALARSGRVAEARTTLVQLNEYVGKTGVGNYEIALVYAGLKENNAAFVWLDKALQSKDKGLTYLLIDPCVDPLRKDTRFQMLLHRVGFPA